MISRSESELIARERANQALTGARRLKKKLPRSAIRKPKIKRTAPKQAD